MLVPFADVPTAIAAVPRIVTQGRTIPASVEFMDRLAGISPVSKSLKVQVNYKDGRQQLSLSLPALAVLELEDVIPEAIMAKLTGSEDLNMPALKQQILESKLKPQVLFDARQNEADYRVWLE